MSTRTLAAHHVDDAVDLGPADRPTVHGEDLVAWQHTGARRWRALDRRDDGDAVVTDVDLHADPCELTLGVALELGELRRAHVARVGVELGDHPAHGAVHQALAVCRLHVALLHHQEHAGHLVERQVWARGLRLGGGRGRRPERARQGEGHGPAATREDSKHRLDQLHHVLLS
jgi:hypothetical protein